MFILNALTPYFLHSAYKRIHAITFTNCSWLFRRIGDRSLHWNIVSISRCCVHSGLRITSSLYGIVTAQSCVYAFNCRDDARSLKSIVAIVWYESSTIQCPPPTDYYLRILESLHTALTVHMMYTYTIIDFGRLAEFGFIIWCVYNNILVPTWSSLMHKLGRSIGVGRINMTMTLEAYKRYSYYLTAFYTFRGNCLNLSFGSTHRILQLGWWHHQLFIVGLVQGFFIRRIWIRESYGTPWVSPSLIGRGCSSKLPQHCFDPHPRTFLFILITVQLIHSILELSPLFSFE